jgi:dephospho-CoA kinase
MGSVRQRPAPRILGLTGPIGCGKSTVGDLLLELGALERIDADQAVHQLMLSGTPTTGQIRSVFGPQVIDPDGSVDRTALGELVFADPQALARLEAIVHPAVRQVIRSRLSDLSRHTGIVVVDAVKLLQSELLEVCDAVWVVRCSAETQMHRLTETRHLTESAARSRMAAQPSFDHPRVTTVIDNSGSMEDLRRRVERAWSALTGVS